MKFADYRIADGIKRSLDDLGFKRPTDIQYKAIGPILKGEDVLAIAQTGTGKTAAFAIPVLHKLQEKRISGRPEGIQCIVLAPTRELILQLTDVFEKLGKHLNLSVTAVIGGVEQDPQIAALQDGIDILLATPGRLFDLVSQGHIKLNRIRFLVLDEADHMLDLGFYKDIRQLLRHLPRRRQTLFFSATINPQIKKLAHSLVHNPIRIRISPKDPVSKNVEHAVCFVSMDDKRFFLENYIQQVAGEKVLVFVRTKVRAERVAKAMQRQNLNTVTIHGDKTQQERLKSLEAFRSGKQPVLITTDVSARGMDLPGVKHVINYDLPDDKPETYVHRIGRTGRGTERGQAISLCSTEEKPMLEAIEAFIHKPIEVISISKADYSEITKPEVPEENNWQALMGEIDTLDRKSKKKRKKGGK